MHPKSASLLRYHRIFKKSNPVLPEKRCFGILSDLRDEVLRHVHKHMLFQEDDICFLQIDGKEEAELFWHRLSPDIEQVPWHRPEMH